MAARTKRILETLLDQTPLVVLRGKKEQEIALALQAEGKAKVTSTSFRSGNRKFVDGGFMTAVETPPLETPAAIVHKLRCAPTNEPAKVDLETVGTAVIAACKNPYCSGFALVVISGGRRYGVAGFKTTPSKDQLAAALESARTYITTHAL